MSRPARDFRTFARSPVLDNGKPLKLQPFQRAFVDDVDAGIAACWFIIPEGNGKTTLLAAFLLWHIRECEFAFVAAAATRDQAMLALRAP